MEFKLKATATFSLLSYKTKTAISWDTSRGYCTCFDLETMKTYAQCPLNETLFVVYICIKPSWTWPLWDVWASSNYLKDRLCLKSSQILTNEAGYDGRTHVDIWKLELFLSNEYFSVHIAAVFPHKKWVYIIRANHWICDKCRKNHTDIIFNHIYFLLSKM